MIDYIQLMTATGRFGSRQEEVSAISRSLKGLATELGVPVIALSQLSRAPTGRANHRPMLSDIRESGAIEQDADVVMFIHREDYYEPETAEKNIAEIIIAKQRNGALGHGEARLEGRVHLVYGPVPPRARGDQRAAGVENAPRRRASRGKGQALIPRARRRRTRRTAPGRAPRSRRTASRRTSGQPRRQRASAARWHMAHSIIDIPKHPFAKSLYRRGCPPAGVPGAWPSQYAPRRGRFMRVDAPAGQTTSGRRRSGCRIRPPRAAPSPARRGRTGLTTHTGGAAGTPGGAAGRAGRTGGGGQPQGRGGLHALGRPAPAGPVVRTGACAPSGRPARSSPGRKGQMSELYMRGHPFPTQGRRIT